MTVTSIAVAFLFISIGDGGRRTSSVASSPSSVMAFSFPATTTTAQWGARRLDLRRHSPSFEASSSSWRRPDFYRMPPSSWRLFSSVGGGNEDGNDGYGNKGGGGGSPLDDWMKGGRDGGDNGEDDSERMQRAREEVAESRLPISYGVVRDDDEGKFGPLGSDDGDDVDDGDDEQRRTRMEDGTYLDAAVIEDDADGEESEVGKGSALARRTPSDESNPYLNVVSRLSPSDLISRFTTTAHPRVQDAVRTTILGLIGGLPQMAFETKTVATGQRLASLMFQLQMTGYMFKNAEYRLSLSQSLGSPVGASDKNLLAGEKRSETKSIKGKIKVRYGGKSGTTTTDDIQEEGSESDAAVSADNETSDVDDANDAGGMEVEVDAAAYISEVRSEISKLQKELASKRQAKDEEVRKDLLRYIRTLPPRELKELTNTMSPDALDAMKGLVNAVLAGISEGEEGDGNGETGVKSVVSGLVGSGAEPVIGGVSDTTEADAGGANIGPETVTEQSGEALAQLCMWQLVVGYNLRELEVREEFKESLTNSSSGGYFEGDGKEEDGISAME